jgi:hypothetical protein
MNFEIYGFDSNCPAEGLGDVTQPEERVHKDPSWLLSLSRIIPYRQDRPVGERGSSDCLDLPPLGRFEGQTRRPGERRAATQQMLAELDALHEVRASVEMKERHEPAIKRPCHVTLATIARLLFLDRDRRLYTNLVSISRAKRHEKTQSTTGFCSNTIDREK